MPADTTITEENIIRTDYSEIMQKNYIDYAMSVIIARALPDVRDGLKPVQRRVLYDMEELGIRYDRPYRKSARIVGDTMGKYHPHGDSSIYDSLVVMAQAFKKGQILVDGHGNFGSIEGDGAAAMRYTEARLAKITQEVYLADLDKDVVDFVPNFDETEKEPTVLPVRIPNILVNGSDGIAVGMATSIPPHNLAETVDAVKAYIKDQNISTEKLMKYIKGPDFPTGGIIVNQDELKQIYETGVGKIRIRGRVTTEKQKGGKTALVITEIPYTMIGAGIGKFLCDAAALSESHVTSSIADISNQSSKDGIRIVIELKKGADPEELKNLLYKKTRLEDTFGVNMLAVCDGRPETMSLKRIIEAHVDFQLEVSNRKYKNLLAREYEKKEIQEGLIKACDVIDLIIEILRGSKNQSMARACLIHGETKGIRFKSEKSKNDAACLCFTEKQATAILDMRLVKLIGLEVDALMAEHNTTLLNIAKYEDILNNYASMARVMIEDLEKIKKEYGHPRLTSVVNAEEIILKEPETVAEEVCFVMDRFGYVRLLEIPLYEKNKEAVDAEYKYVFRVMNNDRMLLFTSGGKLHIVRVSELPYGKMKDKGIPIDNVSNYSNASEEIISLLPLSTVRESTLFFACKSGLVRRVPGIEFDSANRTVVSAKLDPDDRLAAVGIADGDEFAVLQSHDGFFIRFPMNEVPILKKSARGVKGIALRQGDFVECGYILQGAKEFTIEYGERNLSLNRLKLSKRAGKGSKNR